MRDYATSDDLLARGVGAGPEDDRTVVDRLVDQIEFADVIVVNKADLVAAAELARLKGILHHLNPQARLIGACFGIVPLDQILSTGLFDFERARSVPGVRTEPRRSVRLVGASGGLPAAGVTHNILALRRRPTPRRRGARNQ